MGGGGGGGVNGPLCLQYTGDNLVPLEMIKEEQTSCVCGVYTVKTAITRVTCMVTTDTT